MAFAVRPSNVDETYGSVVFLMLRRQPRSKLILTRCPYTTLFRSRKLTEKRIVTYNPKLAEKQKYEINKQVEKAKLLKASEAKKSEYGDSAKYVSFVATDKKGTKTDGKIKVVMNDKAIGKARELAGYNMMVTSEIKMSAKEIYTAYHNLWRIEESFKIMKSQLDARPVYECQFKSEPFVHLILSH